ncbi:MAG: S-layer family protein, partial [Oscillatoriales cyanobacterium RM2_1_1]|nr:S-layer family protein [Oscillatoriales cyanobacterium RM2_1_1]
LNVPIIELRDGAITTNATGTATGGNININTELLTARNSQISASAVEGTGGNIQIQSQGVFADQIPTVTASSEFGFDGTVEIDTTVDPAQGIIQLPRNVIDASAAIAENLCNPEEGRIAKSSSLIVTGRGGLPPNPTEAVTVLQGLVEWEGEGTVELDSPRSGLENPELENRNLAGSEGKLEVDRDNLTKTNGAVVVRPRYRVPEIQQTQGWVVDAQGQIVLTASPNNSAFQATGLRHPDCEP